MYGLPDGVTAMNEDPYNVGGVVSWYCHFLSDEMAQDVLRRAFPEGAKKGFSPCASRPGTGSESRRAKVIWEFNGSVHIGDVLVDKALNPVGFYLEVHTGYMVFNLHGDYIPCARFPDDHQAIRELVY